MGNLYSTPQPRAGVERSNDSECIGMIYSPVEHVLVVGSVYSTPQPRAEVEQVLFECIVGKSACI